VEEVQELDELLGGDGSVVAEELLHPALLADCRNSCLGLEPVGLLWDADVVVLGVPGTSGEGGKAKDCLIKVVELEASGLGFVKASNHLLKEVPVVALLNLNWWLGPSDALEGDLEPLVYSADESWRDMDLRELPVEHDSALLQREVRPVVQGSISCQVLHVLQRKLSSLNSSLAEGSKAVPKIFRQKGVDPVPREPQS